MSANTHAAIWVSKRLPCLKCNELFVKFGFFVVSGRPICEELYCENCESETRHLLAIEWIGTEMMITYRRFNARFNQEFYERPDDLPAIKLKLLGKSRRVPKKSLVEDQNFDPIIVYPRKEFDEEEIKSIWSKTNGVCHICKKKKWRLNQRSARGWHIDHKIAHSTGGPDTEQMINFFVACAKCNLSKGTGIKAKDIREALEEIRDYYLAMAGRKLSP